MLIRQHNQTDSKDFMQMQQARGQTLLTLSFQTCKVVLVDSQRFQVRGLLQLCSVYSTSVVCTAISAASCLWTLQQANTNLKWLQKLRVPHANSDEA